MGKRQQTMRDNRNAYRYGYKICHCTECVKYLFTHFRTRQI